MDHKTAYAHHIAEAIRHKKAMAREPKEEMPIEEEFYDGGDGLDDLSADLPPEEPVDPRLARKERIKQILAR